MTGRARRCGWLDAALLKRSIIINGISGLCITKLDVLDGLAEIKVCVGYELRGERIDILPLDADDIVACVPIYDTFPGWPESTFGATRWDALPQNARRYLERVESLIGAPIDMVSTGPDREHTILLRHPVPAGRRVALGAAPDGASRSSLSTAEDDMLTDDGKHLYVSWDEYHMLIERLALKIDASGWQFDQILCLARGGMRPGDVLSRVFDKPLAIMATSSYRAEAGTIQGRLDLAKYITLPRGELAGRVLLVDDLADSGITLRAVVDRLRGMPQISELQVGGDLDQGRFVVHARLLRRNAGHEPVDPSAFRGVRRLAAGRSGPQVPDLKTKRKGRQSRPASPSNIWCPGRDSNPHGVTR